MISLKRAVSLLAILAIMPSALAAPTPAPELPRTGLDNEIIYFVMPDRYRNGDVNNDRGPGFDPTSTAFYHGGDLVGLTGNCKDDDGLARLKRLGFTAIWLTPLVVQQPPISSGAGYHGYWGVDFLDVDPRLGTKSDLIALSDCAKRLGLKLILDVVTNHTGDIIRYRGQEPYVPAELKDIKRPAWLNDISNYHNVGDIGSCWSEGSCIRDGDFYGLDDLATEKPVVYQGWGDVYGQWIKEFGFVGFRVDTARHLDPEFFKRWSPLITASAASVGIDDFTIFGEVWEQNPIELMNYIRVRKMQTALDFPFQRVVVDYAASSSDAEILRNLFEYDDYYTSASSSASNMVTFLGNHDMGRAAFLIETANMNPSDQLLDRTKLAYAILYLSRGIPTVYYGDEVGMTGSESGKDQLARQNMFQTKVMKWQTERRVGSSSIGDSDSFRAKRHPIADHLVALSLLRSRHPALANGQMQIRYAKGSVFAFSKRALNDRTEYVVIANNSAQRKTVSIPTGSKSNWLRLLGKARVQNSGFDLKATIPAFDVTVLQAKSDIAATQIKLSPLKAKEDFLSGFYRVTAPVVSRDLVTAEFLVRTDGEWRSVGVDLNTPFRVYLDPAELNGDLEVKAIIRGTGGIRESKPISLRIAAP